MSSTGISILGKNGSNLESIASTSNALSVNLAVNNAGTLAVSDSTAQSTLSSINSALGGSLSVSDSTAQGSLSTIATEITSVDNKLPAVGQNNKAASVSVTLASDQGSLAVSDSAAQASLSTIAGDTTSLDGKIPSVGQAAMAASVPVVIASNQSNLPVTMGSLSASSNTAFSSQSVSNSTTALSSAIDLNAVREVSIIGDLSENGAEVEILVSADDSNYFKRTDMSLFSDFNNGNFGKSFKVNARYLKVQYVNDSGSSQTISAFIVHKS